VARESKVKKTARVVILISLSEGGTTHTFCEDEGMNHRIDRHHVSMAYAVMVRRRDESARRVPKARRSLQDAHTCHRVAAALDAA
jgi:hypothetical protein